MSLDDLLPYRVLVFDDKEGVSAWGPQQVKVLRGTEFKGAHVSTWEAAEDALAEAHWDIIILDLDLNGPRTGEEFLEHLRETHRTHPVILVTGNEGYLERPIHKYAHALASGPVTFYAKDSEEDLLELLREASNRVDPIRRTLSLMKAAGMESREFQVDGETYSVDDLLKQGQRTDAVVRSLRESLQAFIVEKRMISN